MIPASTPGLSLTERAFNLFSPDGKRDPGGGQYLVADLKTKARTGHGEAMDLLVNLACSLNVAQAAVMKDGKAAPPGDSAQVRTLRADTARAATEALLAICQDPEVEDRVREEVRRMACLVCETVIRAETDKTLKEKNAGLLHAQTPLMSLALGYASANGLEGTKKEIGSRLAARVPDLHESAGQLATASRFVSFEEIGKCLKSLQALAIRELPLICGADGFATQMQRFFSEAEKGPQPLVAIVQQGRNHWVTIVAGPAQGEEGRVDVAVFDSLHAPTDEAAQTFEATIRNAAGGTIGDYTHTGANLQEHAVHGCGAFCVQAIRTLDKSRPTAMSEVVTNLEEQTRAMEQWRAAQVNGVIAALRAEMLWRIEPHDDSPIEF